MINENVRVLPWVVELDPDLVVNVLVAASRWSTSRIYPSSCLQLQYSMVWLGWITAQTV